MRQFYILLFAIFCGIDIAGAQTGDATAQKPARADSAAAGIISSLHEPDDQTDDDGHRADFAMLGAYRDFFSQASDFSLSMVRYRARGYESRYGEFRWNGIRIEDWWRGSVSWNLIGPLTSIPDRSASVRGLLPATGITVESAGISGVAGSTRAVAYPDELRTGGKLAWSSSNRTYTNRATAGYNVSHTGNGWAFTAEASRRWGRSLTVDGTFADTWGFFASVSKEIGSRNFLSLTVLYAPSQRGLQNASTAEAYSLTGNNLYNPNWGMQSGKERTARIRESNQPMAILNHRIEISSDVEIRNAVAVRGGRESYSALNWQNAQNPYPDYYRNMPSHQDNPQTAQRLAEMWRSDVNVRQIDFEGLYEHNRYNSPRAHYIVENRVRDILEGTIQSYVTARSGNTMLNGGIELFAGRTRNYKTVKDLLGAGYWLDIDQFVEYDDDYKEKTQNDLRNPDRHVREGDRFGYDYALNIGRATAWFGVEHQTGNFRLSASAGATGTVYEREGFYEKENFPGRESFGRSARSHHLDYIAKAGIEYRRGGRLRLALGFAAQSLSPSARTVFISPDYRNALTPGLGNESIVSGELAAEYRTPLFRAGATVYGTLMKNRSELSGFYDDMDHFYCNYMLEGIDTHYAGAELYGEVMITEPLWLSVAGAASNNQYDSSPTGTQWRETSGDKVRSERVYYKGLHIPSSPQFVGVVSLSFRPRGWIVNLSVNGFDKSYISPTPLRRTIRAVYEAGSPEMVSEMMAQEKFPGGMTIDIFAGKSFYFRGNGSLGIYAGVNNLGDNRNIISGGYEAARLRYRGTEPYSYMKPMDSKYYYALGINFFVNVTYRF